MANSAPDQFQCPSCGRRFTWKPAFAAHNVKCTCGAVFNPKLPRNTAAPPNKRRGDPRAASPPVQSSAPSAAMASAHAAVVAREAQERSTAVVDIAAFPITHRAHPSVPEEDDPHRFRHFYFPLILLLAGAMIWLVLGIFSQPAAGRGIVFNIAMVIVTMACNTAVMLVAMIVAAYVLSVNCGQVGQVLIKLSAMAVFCGAIFVFIAQLDPHSLRGPILAWHVVVLFYWMLYSILFELDVQETVMSVAIVAIAQAVVAWVVMH